MKLNVIERILLHQMVKTAFKQGSLIEMMSVEHIIKKISFSEKEISLYELKSEENGSVTWNASKAVEKDFDFTKEQIEILNKVIEYYDQNKLIELSMITLVVKIKELSETNSN